jgi:hypothetical protein
MRKSIVVIAMLAVATSVAVAKDLKQDKRAAAPAVTAAQMTDAEMNKVTAGNNGLNGAGVGYGNGNGCNCGRGADRNNVHARF